MHICLLTYSINYTSAVDLLLEYSFITETKMTCVVPGCNSNYKSQEHRTPTFSFPKDKEMCERWFRAIPRPKEDYEANAKLRVS